MLAGRKTSDETTVGKIAENMARILEELKEERKEYRDSIEKLVTAILESREVIEIKLLLLNIMINCGSDVWREYEKI